MPGRLQDKVCLITGATGIAAATAQRAAREGARVFVTSLVPEQGAALLEQITADGGTAVFHPADLTRAEAAAEAVARCVARFRRLDALFNVVGISARPLGDGPVHECSDAAWAAAMDVNVKTTFLMCRAALRQMLAQPPDASGLRGAILNMSSVLAFAPAAPHFSTHAYAASKGALLSLSRAMAAHYAPYKIRVNALAPGLVRTPMSARAQQDAAILHLMRTKQPLAENLLEADAVARAAVFLLSDDAAMITGQVLTVDGGWCVSKGQA